MPDGNVGNLPVDPPPGEIPPGGTQTFTLAAGEWMEVGRTGADAAYITVGNDGGVWLVTNTLSAPEFTLLKVTDTVNAAGQKTLVMEYADGQMPPAVPPPIQQMPPAVPPGAQGLPPLQIPPPAPPGGWTGSYNPTTGITTLTLNNGPAVVAVIVIKPDGTISISNGSVTIFFPTIHVR